MNLWKEIYLPLAIIACTPLFVCLINDIRYAAEVVQDFLAWRKEQY